MKIFKRTIYLFYITGIIFVIMCLIGILTRNSFKDNLSPKAYMSEQYKVDYLADLGDGFESNKIKDLESLAALADVVVKVKVNEDRKMYYGITISNADVIDVYKGNLEEDNIFIGEPVYFFSSGEYVVSLGGYYWMNYEDEYLMFLNEVKDPHLGKQEYIYVPVSLATSKYNLSQMDDLKKTKNSLMYEKIYNEIDNYFK